MVGDLGIDLVFTLGWETLADLDERQWMRPPDRILLHLLAAPAVSRLLVGEPPRNPLAALTRSPHARTVPLPPACALPGRHVVSPFHFGRPRPQTIGSARRRYLRLGRTLHGAAARRGLNEPIVLSTDPLLLGLADLSWARRRVYYARDDWSAHPGYVSLRPALVAAYEGLRGSGTDVVAVSRPLLEVLRPTGRCLHLPNGVEPEEWLAPTPASAPAAAAAAAAARAGAAEGATSAGAGPVAVYAGSVDSRLDVDWVRAIADAGVEVVLAGPQTEPGVGERLAHPRIRLPGRLSRSEVAALIRSADVGLVPHVASDLTRAMDPLKLYEYLGAGKPVLATDLPPLRGYGDRVVLVSSPAQRPAALARALSMPEWGEPERRAFLQANSWAGRAAALLGFLGDVGRGGGNG